MKNVKEIAKKIENAGGRLYLVGGAVRDEILGKTNFDEDYCVTGITFKEFEELFPNAHIRGKSFAVFDIDRKEFALARTETKNGTRHKDFEIKTSKNITIEQDLARRDITINAIAKDVLTGEIIDPYNGIQDLKNKIIKATTEHFKEDSLRVYRVARIAASLNFEVEKTTIDMMKQLKEELYTLSKERVFTEFMKAMKTDKPSIFFEVLKEAQVLDVHFKEISSLIGVEQPIIYHPEGDAYTHTMIVLDNSANLTKNLDENRKLQIRYSALVHDLGKGATPKEQYPHHYSHDIRGVELVKSLSKRINVPKSWLKCGITSCKEHMLGGIFEKMTPAKKVTFIERVNSTILGLEGLQIIVICDKMRPNINFDINDNNFFETGKKILNKIDGKYIQEKYKIPPGKQLKNKLHEERVIWLKEHKI